MTPPLARNRVPRLTALLGAMALATILPTTVMAQSPSSLVDIDDPVAPGGATIGAKVSDAEAALTRAGYRKTGACRYAKSVGSTGTALIVMRTGRAWECKTDVPVSGITYQVPIERLVEPPADLVGRFSRRLGVEPKCVQLSADGAGCDWWSPPAAPLVRKVTLSYGLGPVSLFLFGTHDPAVSGITGPPSKGSASKKVQSSTTRPETAAAGAPQQGRFEIEGVQLGMTPAQVTAALQAKGFVPIDGGKGGSFVREEATATKRGPQKSRAGVTYLRPTGQYRTEQAESVRIGYPNPAKERELKKYSLYADLVSKYGDPDECKSNSSCIWVRRTDGWGETLELQLSLMTNVMLKATDLDRAKFSQLAASASVPTRVESQSAPTSAKTPVAPPADLDALAPHGVRVGMPYSDFVAALKTAGFKGASCRWLREQGSRGEEISIQIAGQRTNCEGAASVERMEYGLYDSGGLGAPPESYIASMNKQFGVDAKCTGRRPDLQKFDCKWISPPNAPYAREITANLSPGRIYYQIHPKHQTALRSSPSTAAKADVPSGDQFWWTQELAKADATGLGKQFAQGEQFKQLPADRQTLLSEQAATVYNYCKGREPFSSLHNCSCVADKFVDARMKAWTEKPAPRPPAANCASGDQGCLFRAKNAQEKWEMEEKMRERRMNDNSQPTVIDLADKEAHQCPSKAGVADYSYKQCITNYRHRMASPDDLRALCTCYADTSATNYMKDPRASFNTLVGAGAGALLECKRQGVPSPLPR